MNNLVASPILMSISRLANEFGMARETVAKRLSQCGVRPSGLRNGYPVYRVKDAALALFVRADYGIGDPSALPADKRNTWYQSENRRMKFELCAQQLIPAEQYDASIVAWTNDIAQFLETLPDHLEHDVALNIEQVQRMRDEINRTRESLCKTVTARELAASVEETA